MISGQAKSEVEPREQEIFATAMSFSDEPVEIPVVEQQRQRWLPTIGNE